MIIDNTNNWFSPIRHVAAKVELFKGSTLVETFAADGALKDFTIERTGEGGKFFGFGVAQTLKLNLLDKQRLIELTDENAFKVYAKCGGDYLNAYPTFYFAELTRDENTNDLSITAKDALSNASDYVVSDLNLQPPYTIRLVAERCAQKLGVSFYTEVENSFDLVLEEGANFGGSETLREALNAIAEATQTIYFINSNNELVFKRLDKEGAAALTIDKSAYMTLTSKPARTLTSVASITDLGDNVIAKPLLTATGEAVKIANASDIVDYTARSKNILPYPFYDTTATVNGITFTDNGDGSVTINGTSTGKAIFYLYCNNGKESIFNLNKNLMISGAHKNSYSDYGYLIEINCTNVNDGSDTWLGDSGDGWLLTTEWVLKNLYILVKEGATFENVTVRPQVEIGETATPYTPYIPEQAKNLFNVFAITGANRGGGYREGNTLYNPMGIYGNSSYFTGFSMNLEAGWYHISADVYTGMSNTKTVIARLYEPNTETYSGNAAYMEIPPGEDWIHMNWRVSIEEPNEYFLQLAGGGNAENYNSLDVGFRNIMITPQESYDIFPPFEPYIEKGLADMGVTAHSKNFASEPIELGKLTYENGVYTQTEPDSRSEPVYFCVCRYTGSTFIDVVGDNLLRGENLSPGKKTMVCNIPDNNYGKLRFGISGQSINCVSYHKPIPPGTYILSFELLETEQGSIAWRNLQIEPGTTATDFEPYVEPTEYAKGDYIEVIEPTTVLIPTAPGVILDVNYHGNQAEGGITQHVKNNPFWDNNNDIARLVDEALAAVNGLTIYPFDCKWRGNPAVEVGDKIELITKDNEAINSFALNDTIKFTGGFTMDSTWTSEETEQTQATPSTIGEVIKQTYARVDRVNNEIVLVAQEVGAIENSTNNAIKGFEENLSALNKRVDMTITPEAVDIKIQQELANGAEKVVTATGFKFDETGLTVEKSGSEIKTQITEDGMAVFKNNEEVLTADNEGVKAIDLHATTYLLIGRNSRFEDYNNQQRTGCFWIGL